MPCSDSNGDYFILVFVFVWFCCVFFNLGVDLRCSWYCSTSIYGSSASICYIYDTVYYEYGFILFILHFVFVRHRIVSGGYGIQFFFIRVD